MASLLTRICTAAEIMLTASVARVTIRLGQTRLGAKAKICVRYTSENTPVMPVENTESTRVLHRPFI